MLKPRDISRQAPSPKPKQKLSPSPETPSGDFNFQDFALPTHVDFSSCPPFRRALLPPSRPTCTHAGLPPSLRTQNAPQTLPRPLSSFTEVCDGLSVPFPSPTPVQSVVIPLLLSGYDVIGVSETGSGKTLSFLVPAALHHRANPVPPASSSSSEPPSTASVLILAPTRELVQQIGFEAMRLLPFADDPSSSYSRDSDLHPLVAVIRGGSHRIAEIRRLRDRIYPPRILVATPGRLLDYLQAGVLRLRMVTFVALDEADAMLFGNTPGGPCGGLWRQLQQVLTQVRPDRQMALLCSTWDTQGQDEAALLQLVQKPPILLQVRDSRGGDDEEDEGLSFVDVPVANRRVEQRFVVFAAKSDALVKRKEDKLVEILEESILEEHSKTLVFCGTKAASDKVSRRLKDDEGIPTLALHSDVPRGTREWILQQFRTDEDLPLLICTDVASRGVDVPECGCVVNFDLPPTIETYIHRVGRTARAERKGVAISFVGHRDTKLVRLIARGLKAMDQGIPTELRSFLEED